MGKNILFFLISIFLFFGCKTSTNSINAPTTEGELLLSKIIVDGKLFKEFIYDDNSKPIQMNQYFNDSISSMEMYEYNIDGQLSKRTYDGKYENFVSSYEYDQNGLLKSYSRYFEKTDKLWKEVYLYESTNLIQKGLLYFNDKKKGYIEYKYDSEGNTILRKEYSGHEGESPFLDAEYRVQYDKYKNPYPIIFPMDVVQKNNVNKFYDFLAVMSYRPPEYESEFEYNSKGLPIKENRQFINGRDTKSIYEYVYISK